MLAALHFGKHLVKQFFAVERVGALIIAVEGNAWTDCMLIDTSLEDDWHWRIDVP
ncbi:MAG: hypothetical protein MZW92_33755 [Comamonadaceae bacterium]|nr:hypothetical protein [Comamonadaceae bacterium]